MGGVSPISYQAISCWAGDHGVSGDAFGRLKRMIRAMDEVWREHSVQKPDGS